MPKRKLTITFITPGSSGTRLKKTTVPYQPRNTELTETARCSNVCPEVILSHSNDTFTPPSPERSYGQSGVAVGRHNYLQRKTRQIGNWNLLRSSLVSAYTELLAPTTKCVTCGEDFDDVTSIYRCEDCTLMTSVCSECMVNAHEHEPLHRIYVWKGGNWVHESLDNCVIKTAFHRNCTDKYQRVITVVDSKGRHHRVSFEFCSCEEEAATLIRHNMWPASPKSPRICFHLHFMEMLRVLYLQVPVPVKDFCEALKYIHHPFITIESTMLQDIYKVLINESFEEYRYFIHQIRNLSEICPEWSTMPKCPACPSQSMSNSGKYQRIIAMDANFGLVRKKSSGTSVEKPKHSGLYFFDQNDVDNFVHAHPGTQAQKDVECNDFKAGSTIRSRKRFEKLDETAVFGASCRHDIPVMMLNMKHGERLSYPVFMMKQLLGIFGPGDNIHFMYDVACMLRSHIQKHHADIPIEQLKLAIPIFHAYGHKLDCQVLYSPRRNEGFALTDGESLERLWSYLRNFSKITKEMTPSHRCDTLTDALIHYTRRNVEKIGTFLCTKMEKAKDVEITSSQQLDSILLSLKATTEDVKQWMQVEFDSVEKSRKGKTSTAKSLNLLHRLCSERRILLEMMKKYAEGQAIAIRLNKNIKRTTDEIKKVVTKINQAGLVPPITFEEAIKVPSAASAEVTQSPPLFREAANCLSLRNRAVEEQTLLRNEMENVVKTYTYFHSALISILPVNTDSTPLILGRQVLISVKIVELERQLQALGKCFGKFIEVQLPSDLLVSKLSCSPIDVMDIGFSQQELDEIIEDVLIYEAEEDEETEESECEEDE